MQAQILIQPLQIASQLPLHQFSTSQAIVQNLSNLSQILLNNKTLNSSLENAIKTMQNVKVTESMANVEEQWNLLFLLRILFYILVFFKLIQLLCSKKKKMDIKERVYRKFYFSHGQVLREFDQDDKKLMDITLNNTIKNAYVQKCSSGNKKKTMLKSVVFLQQKNQYYQPQSQFDEYQSRIQQQIKQNQLIHMKLLQAIRPMCKQPEQQFDIIGVISENNHSNHNQQLKQQGINSKANDTLNDRDHQHMDNKDQCEGKQKTT